MKELFNGLFDERFMPHGHCFLWTRDILWAHVGSDLVIALAYYTIPIALWVLVRKRRDLVFNWMFLMFAVFIFACGTTHLLDIWNIWHSHYRLEGIIKIMTAAASITTAALLIPLIPKVMALPSPETLRQMNQSLQEQISERINAERALQKLNSELEQRVTERTEELKKSNHDLELFAYVASHDLQQPVRTICSMVELLEKRLDGEFDSDTSQYFSFVKEGCGKMGQLIRDLLSYSRLGTREAALQTVNAREAVEASLADLRTMLEESKVTVHVSDLPVVVYDSSHLRQIFQNLITNAVKYRQAGDPQIWIGSARNGKGWEFSVRDNGIGIPPEFHDAIFELFRRLHSDSEIPGSGMGLAICKKVVELHGGQIRVESVPNTGSTFWFTVPDRASASARSSCVESSSIPTR